MNSASGTYGSITKDVTFVSLEFWKEQNKGRVGKVLKKKTQNTQENETAAYSPNLARDIDLRFKKLSEA